MHYTVAPAAPQVSTQVTTPVVSSPLATPFGSVNQPHISANYVPMHDITTTRAWTQASAQNQGPSQLSWLAIPSIAVVVGWLMGRAFVKKEEPVTSITDSVALAPVSANKMPFGGPEKMVKSGVSMCIFEYLGFWAEVGVWCTPVLPLQAHRGA